MTEVSKTRISKILDRATEGGGTHKIAKGTGEAPSTVWRIMKEFPLWDYFRKHPQVGSGEE